MEKQWNKVLALIQEQVSSANFRTWFAQTHFDSLVEETLTIRVPSAFVKDNLLAKYKPLLQSTIELVFGQNYSLVFRVNPSSTKPPEDGEMDFVLTSGNSRQPMSSLNPKYTLESFVVGLSNNLAYAAAQAVVQAPGTTYNPLFIYGGTGVGKTHLMHGIGNALIKRSPPFKIIYCPSERFMNDFIESIQNKRTNEFRHKYRSCDLLLIDDIQFISGRDSTQEEFFHTFNELQVKNTQVVLTSDRPPGEIQKLEPRLQSRFQGGLMVDIQLPDFDTRVAILKAKCAERGEIIEEGCLTLIAETMTTNARELEGKLIQLIQAAKLNNTQVSEEYVRNFLGKPQRDVRLDQKKVLTTVNQYFNIKNSDLVGPRRKKELVVPRQIAMFLLYEECKIPYERIGELLGGRDHTTIMHGVEKIKQSISRDREIQRLIIEVKQNLTN